MMICFLKAMSRMPDYMVLKASQLPTHAHGLAVSSSAASRGHCGSHCVTELKTAKLLLSLHFHVRNLDLGGAGAKRPHHRCGHWKQRMKRPSAK